jgi:hypothetical protein
VRAARRGGRPALDPLTVGAVPGGLGLARS